MVAQGQVNWISVVIWIWDYGYYGRLCSDGKVQTCGISKTAINQHCFQNQSWITNRNIDLSNVYTQPNVFYFFFLNPIMEILMVCFLCILNYIISAKHTTLHVRILVLKVWQIKYPFKYTTNMFSKKVQMKNQSRVKD